MPSQIFVEAVVLELRMPCDVPSESSRPIRRWFSPAARNLERNPCLQLYFDLTGPESWNLGSVAK